MPVEAVSRIPIESDADVVVARQRARSLAAELDLSSTDQTLLATAISEVARNITTYAKRGEVSVAIVGNSDRRGIRSNRARVVVIDITGVPTIDSTVANHLVQTVDASRLMGASVIITGLSPEIAQTLVTLGVDLSKVNAIGDLQGGIEEAERLLGYTVIGGGAEVPAETG